MTQPAPPEDNLQTLLTEIDAAVDEVVRHAQDPEKQDPVRLFMRHIYRLGLAVHTHPDWYNTPQFRNFLDKTAPLLANALPPVLQFVGLFEDSFYGVWEGDWRYSCEVRSSIEFLFELYKDTVFANTFSSLDLTELNWVMDERARWDGYIASDTIPLGVPRSHWWWYPNDLPPPNQV